MLQNLGDCTLFFGGQEVAVTEVQVEFSPSEGTRLTVEGVMYLNNEDKQNSNIDILEKETAEMAIDRIDCETKCSDEGVYREPVHELRKLNLKADAKLLQKYDIESRAGDLTYAGKEFLLEILYQENKTKVVEALREIEKAKAAEKKK